MPDRLLTVEEVADLFHTTPGSIHVRRSRGVEPFNLGVRVAGSRVLWRESDIDAWLAEQVAAITEQAEGADR